MMLANPTRQMFAQQTTNEMDGAGIDHRHHHHQGLLNTAAQQQQRPRPQRKRKAEAQPENNERLSKRMSLLNLEHGGTKLYVPVENPQLQPSSSSSLNAPNSSLRKQSPTHNATATPNEDDDIMHLDDTKYKVYIYNMEDELASSESEAEDGGKLVFLPDIEKHLRNNRILPPYINPSADPASDLASQMQLVLYNIPSSISVPEEQDSVRKAIIEARARMRERQAQAQEAEAQKQQLQQQTLPTPVEPLGIPPTNGFQSCAPGLLPQQGTSIVNDDPDAMELD